MTPQTRIAWLIATIGGLGHVRFAPGTLGSLVGLIAGSAAVVCLSPPMRWLLLGAGFVLAAVLSTAAERALGGTDPPAIILDEVWAMAAVLVFLPWLVRSWMWMAAACFFFRAFDILKPPPARRLSRLPGGWGVVADDLAAALYTVVLLVFLRRLL